jgi:hypothetical protein
MPGLDEKSDKFTVLLSITFFNAKFEMVCAREIIVDTEKKSERIVFFIAVCILVSKF